MGTYDVKYAIEKNYMLEPRRFGANLLYQVGKIHSAPSNVISLHAHLNWYELTVITGGSGEVITNGEALGVSRGDIYFSLPSEFHEIRSSEEDPLNFSFFAFGTEDSLVGAELDRIGENCMLSGCRVFSDERVDMLVGNLISEMTDGDEYSERQINAIIEQIICYTLRAFCNIKDRQAGRNVGKAEEFCYRIMNYIDTHIYTMSSLFDVAEAMHYNYSYISDLFKRTVGETLSSYYRRRRLDAARILLGEGKLSVTQISELLNFSSIYTFSRSYKDYFGISPNVMRKSLKNEQQGDKDGKNIDYRKRER